MVVRCLVVAAIMAMGFSGLSYLSALHRVATRSLQGDPEIGNYAMNVGIACMAPFCLVVLIAELQISLLLSGHWTWKSCSLLLPTSFALLGGLFAFLVFQPGEHGPKETMLIFGGVLTAFLGSLMHLSLRWEREAAGRDMEWPFAWTVALILLAATFLGAMKGWTGPSRQFRDVVSYSNHRWPEGQSVPTPPMIPVEEPLIH